MSLERVWSHEDCTVSIPFYVEDTCDKIIKKYLHVDIAVYIDVLYMVPMQDTCWQCALKENKHCGDVMDWSLNGQCYSFTTQTCGHECAHTQDKLRKLVEKAPIFPVPPKIPEPLKSTLRQRLRPNGLHKKKCLTKNTDENFSLTLCEDNDKDQQFSVFPIKNAYLIMHSPKKEESTCEKKRNENYWSCNVPGCMITQCDANGQFIPRQCHLSVGYTGTCWCVDINGEEIEGTKTNPGEEPPKCAEFPDQTEVGPELIIEDLSTRNNKKGSKKKKRKINFVYHRR